jgi:autotransporter passenger strand-loop-strand repeat protein
MGSALLIGVNLAGAEFGSNVPGTFGVDYTYPTHAEIDYYAAKGLSVIRLPFLWERLQRTEFGSLDATELARLDDVVNYATSKGLNIEIEPHDYGYGFGALIGSAQTPNSAFADFWSKLAAHFKSNPKVIFGLMNEPHDQSASVWLVSANAAIAAIRNAGAVAQEILVPGSYWDGAWTWTTTDNAAVIGTGVVDSAHNFAFEVHQYLDSDGSGTHPGAVSATIGVERLTAVTQWAESTGNRLFLGEVGVTTDQTSLTALDGMLTYMGQHADAWQGMTYWAGGPWWGNYMFTIEPQNGVDRPQMTVLLQHLAPASPPTSHWFVSAGVVSTGVVVSAGNMLEVLSGGEADSSLVTAGGALRVGAGGTASGTTVSNGGGVILAGGTESRSVVAAGGYELLRDGAEANSATVTNLGLQYVGPGAAASGAAVGGTQIIDGVAGATVVNGGTVLVLRTGIATDMLVSGSRAAVVVLNGGQVSGTILSSGALLAVENGGSASGTTVSSGGRAYVWSNGTALGTTVSDGGRMYISAGGTASGILIGSGGYAIAGGNVSGAIISGGTLEIAAGGATGSAVTFASGGGGVLRLDNSVSFGGLVAGFGPSDFIDLRDIAFGPTTSATYISGNAGNTSGTLLVSDGVHSAHIALLGQYVVGQFTSANDGGGGTKIGDPPVGSELDPSSATLTVHNA